LKQINALFLLAAASVTEKKSLITFAAGVHGETGELPHRQDIFEETPGRGKSGSAGVNLIKTLHLIAPLMSAKVISSTCHFINPHQNKNAHCNDKKRG
jgi:hypothetical protein